MITRRLSHYPRPVARRAQLVLVVSITVALYYALYIGGGVAPLMMHDLNYGFTFLTASLAIGNLLGAFASLSAGLLERIGRANLVLAGLLAVGVLTAFAMPAVRTPLQSAIVGVAVGCIEGIILVSTPALTRDFSPQVGRATAMGAWAMGPVLGSLTTSLAVSFTLGMLPDWRDQYRLCGAICLAMAAIAFVFLRELSPGLRDQVIEDAHALALIEARAHQAAAAPPRLAAILGPRVLASALGVSVLLLVYYTTVAFGVIYLVQVFALSPQRANALLNWNWAANAVALPLAGAWSDRTRARRPFMLAGGAAAALLIWLFLARPAAAHPSFAAMAAIGSAIAVVMGAAYAAWMAHFTELLEAIDPRLVGAGLAIWGWLLRLIVSLSFLLLPMVIGSAAAREAWQHWYAICALGAVAFVLVAAITGKSTAR